MENKEKGIDIVLIEGRNYFVRYWKFWNWTGKRKIMEQFHGRLVEINLDQKRLTFDIDEYYGNHKDLNFKDVCNMKNKTKLFWTKRIFGFEILVDNHGKFIRNKYNCSGCVVDYPDYADLKKKLEKLKHE
ncbi:hypothetical protein M0R04_08790 [Candidatus Dojkabacteria bacterium]|jgi:hypothetical protein|nr:hypothetical protein [Candidatus Dojkabacteria bacterium]